MACVSYYMWWKQTSWNGQSNLYYISQNRIFHSIFDLNTRLPNSQIQPPSLVQPMRPPQPPHPPQSPTPTRQLLVNVSEHEKNSERDTINQLSHHYFLLVETCRADYLYARENHRYDYKHKKVHNLQQKSVELTFFLWLYNKEKIWSHVTNNVFQRWKLERTSF